MPTLVTGHVPTSRNAVESTYSLTSHCPPDFSLEFLLKHFMQILKELARLRDRVGKPFVHVAFFILGDLHGLFSCLMSPVKVSQLE